MGKPRRRKRPHAHSAGPDRAHGLHTARVPKAFEPAFREAEGYVSRYFSRRSANPGMGMLTISDERYVLLRAASMSVEFFDLVTSLYRDKGPDEARLVASNLLFDVAHALGKADARAFHRKMNAPNPVKKLSTGPIHFSFAGWAFVDIHPESHVSPDDDYFLLYDHLHSFESSAWLKRGRKTTFPVCVMSAGYSSGWCEESFGIPLVAVEIDCLVMGGARCRFIMAPTSRIEDHVARIRKRAPATSAEATPPGGAAATLSIPEFFQRKRLEDELRRSHENLESRIEQRTSELVTANDRLREEIAERTRAEKVRDEFISVAAHELKTPLTGLRGFAQILLRQIGKGCAVDPRVLRRSAEAIQQQAEKLSRLVAQLLDISRLQGGRLTLDPAMTDVVALVEAAVHCARAGTTRHEIAVHAPPSAVISVDPMRLEQVLMNILDNAIKYSPEGGAIAVDVSEIDGSVRIAVTDHGIGVPPEHRGRIFERFYQVEPTSQRLGGMGLGLYISRQIIDVHGGKLAMEFPDGGGTRVLIDLPRGERAP